MRIAILGAGSIAFGAAAFLCHAGHQPVLWSPSGAGTKALAAGAPLVATGQVEGEFHPEVAATCAEALEGAEAVLFALPANGHRMAMEAAAEHLKAGQTVMVSSHSSLGGLYLSKLLAKRGVTVPIVAWGTTVNAGRKTGDAEVNVAVLRAKVDAAVLPVSETGPALEVCRSLFGDRFIERPDILAIQLSNLNPQNHMGIALCNFTRMEKGERWGQTENTTDSVGNLLQALDLERLAIAKVLGYEVRSIQEHYNLSFQVKPGRVGDMAREIAERGNGGFGPTTIDTRYVLEDAPYGLAVTGVLGRMTGVDTPLHEAGVSIFSALYERDLGGENDLLPELDLEGLGLDALRELVRDGWKETV